MLSPGAVVISLVPKENDKLTMGTIQASWAKSHHQPWFCSVKIQTAECQYLQHWPKVVWWVQLQPQLGTFGLFEVLRYSEAPFLHLVNSSLGAEWWVVVTRVEKESLGCLCVCVCEYFCGHHSKYVWMHLWVVIHVDMISLVHSSQIWNQEGSAVI